MSNYIKIIIALCLVLTILVPTYVYAKNKNFFESDEKVQTELINKDNIKQETDLHEDLISIENELSKYESVFGGIYINDSNEITVQITEEVPEIKNKILSLVKNPNKITFEQVKFTKKQLEESKNELIEKQVTFKGIGVDIKLNKIVVLISENENKKDIEKVLERLIDPEMLSIGVMGDIIDQ